MFFKNLVVFCALGWAIPASAASIDSVYTNLINCKTISVLQETGASTQKCPGVAGHQLLIEDDDDRQSITVITPDKKEHSLDFWKVITPAFCSVGKKAEWRVQRNGKKVKPIAVIVRVYAKENADSPLETSYLAVAKITPEHICVTDRVKESPTANEDARRAADASASSACLK